MSISLQNIGQLAVALTALYVLRSTTRSSAARTSDSKLFHAEGTFPFLALPRELRDMIYEEVLDQLEMEPQTVSQRRGMHIRTEERYPDRIRIPGYRRPFIRWTIHNRVERREKMYRGPNPRRLRTRCEIVFSNAQGLRALRMVCRQVRDEALEVWRRRGIAFETVGPEGWRAFSGWVHSNEGAMQTLSRIHLVLNVSAVGYGADTRVNPVLRLEIVDSGQKLVVSSKSAFIPGHALMLEDEIIRNVRRAHKAGATRFTGHDLVSAARGVHAAEQKVHVSARSSMASHDYGKESGRFFALQPTTKDVTSDTEHQRGQHGESCHCARSSNDRYDHEVVVLTAREMFHRCRCGECGQFMLQPGTVRSAEEQRRWDTLALADLEREEDIEQDMVLTALLSEGGHLE